MRARSKTRGAFSSLLTMTAVGASALAACSDAAPDPRREVDEAALVAINRGTAIDVRGALFPRPLRYNQVYQKSAHNTYQKNEDLLDVLLYLRVRSIEFDLQSSRRSADVAPAGDWYLEHNDWDLVTNYEYAST